MKAWTLAAAAAACLATTPACRATPPAPPAAAPAPEAAAAAPAPEAAAPAAAPEAAAPAPAPAAPATPPQDQATMVKEAEKRVRALLATEAAGRPIAVHDEEGPAGTRIVHGLIDGAYPGSGARAAVVTREGRVLGPRSPQALADLARASGWLEASPPAGDVVRLVDALLFDGVLALAPKREHAIELMDGTLVLDLTRLVFPSQAEEAVRVAIGAAGPAEVSIAGKPVAIGVSAVEELEAAVASDDAAGMARGVQALTGTTDPRGRAALASVTARGGDELAATAMLALGSSAEAAAALKAAWADLPAARRDALRKLAAEAFGAEFAARLE